MNSESNAVHDSPAVPAPRMTEPRPLYWSMRRELWENRFLYLAPLIITVVVFSATMLSVLIKLTGAIASGAAIDRGARMLFVAHGIGIAPAPIMFTTILVGLFYCLDALYGERRDRSILFWKSLPVSDRTTVVAKASIPLVVLPLIAFALSVAIQLLMLPLSSFLLLATGGNPIALWSEVRFFRGLPIMIYGLAVHALWYAPIYGWLLLVSAWAKRAMVLWAILPPLALFAVERMAFGSMHFAGLVQYRITGAMQEAFVAGSNGNIDRLSQLTPARFLGAPGLWFGLLFAAACLTAAVRLRRNREPI